MPRLIVQGTTPDAIAYGMLCCLEQHDEQFRLSGKTGRAMRKARRLRQQSNEVVAYGMQWAGEHRECFDGTSSAKELARLAMAGPDAPAVGGPIATLLLGVLARWLVQLVLELLFAWLLSAESETFRLSAKGDA